MRRLVAVVGIFLAATTTQAASKPEQASIWASRPSAEDLARVIPSDVREAGGEVILRCKADPDGGATDCALLSEAPTGRGLGQALIGLSAKYRLKPEALKTEAADGQMIVAENWYKVDTQATWRRKPTPEDLRVVWPGKAWSQGRGGKATISCLVALTGNLYSCVILHESPAGQGFGLAAIALTPQFLMWPAKRGGVPITTAVFIPINFDMHGFAGGPGTAIPGRTALPAAAISWTAAPSLQDVAAAYPARARAARLPGFASLQCDVLKDGRLGGCDLMREEPRDQGFGTAAKTLVRGFQLDPALLKELSVKQASVSLPFAFDPKVFDGTGGKPLWTRTPDAAALQAAFSNLKPAASSGLAVISCQVQPGGTLDACTVASESPAGSGLGQTALALRDGFRLATWSEEGLPVVGARVHVPVRFNFDAPPPPAPAQAPPPKP